MRTKLSVVTGSLLGAVVIHLVVIACSARGGGGVVGPVDPPGVDGAVADAPGVDGSPGGPEGGALDAMMTMLRDAAAMVTDAVADTATAVRDAEVPDAHAGGGRTVEVPCEQTGGYVATHTGGTTIEGTLYYAIAPAAVAPRDAPEVRAVVCDRIDDPSPCAAYAAAPGYTCRTSGFVAAREACTQTSVTFDAGRVVAYCGITVRTTTSGTTTTTNSFRYRRAFIHLP